MLDLKTEIVWNITPLACYIHNYITELKKIVNQKCRKYNEQLIKMNEKYSEIRYVEQKIGNNS